MIKFLSVLQPFLSPMHQSHFKENDLDPLLRRKKQARAVLTVGLIILLVIIYLAINHSLTWEIVYAPLGLSLLLFFGFMIPNRFRWMFIKEKFIESAADFKKSQSLVNRLTYFLDTAYLASHPDESGEEYLMERLLFQDITLEDVSLVCWEEITNNKQVDKRALLALFCKLTGKSSAQLLSDFVCGGDWVYLDDKYSRLFDLLTLRSEAGELMQVLAPHSAISEIIMENILDNFSGNSEATFVNEEIEHHKLIFAAINDEKASCLLGKMIKSKAMKIKASVSCLAIGKTYFVKEIKVYDSDYQINVDLLRLGLISALRTLDVNKI